MNIEALKIRRIQTFMINLAHFQDLGSQRAFGIDIGNKFPALHQLNYIVKNLVFQHPP